MVLKIGGNDMLQEMNKNELMAVDGGFGLIGVIVIGGVILLVGTALGLGVAYIVSKI